MQPPPIPDNQVPGRPSRIDPNDPIQQMYLEELARLRRDDLKRTLEEDQQEDSEVPPP